MKKLAALTEFLLQLNLVASEQLESWAEDAKLVFDGSVISNGDDGLVLFRQEYTAQFVIERFDHKHHAAELLFAQVIVWLETFDNEPWDDNRTPEFDIDILDNDLADITISIEFDEHVQIVPDVAGEISYLGQQWRITESEIDYALEGDVST